MCDYCDCRSVPLIDALGEDHGVLLAMADDVLRALEVGDVSGAEPLMADLLDLLDEHTRLEEVALFPLLAATGPGAPTVATLLAEHAIVDGLGGQLADAGDPHWAAVATELVASLRAHIHREEHDVFPAAVQLVPADRWDEAHLLASAHH